MSCVYSCGATSRRRLFQAGDNIVFLSKIINNTAQQNFCHERCQEIGFAFFVNFRVPILNINSFPPIRPAFFEKDVLTFLDF